MRAASGATTLFLLVSAGCLNAFAEPIPPHHVEITSIDVAAPRITSATVLLRVNVTLDVTQGSTPPVRIEIKAFDSETRLLVSSTSRDVGPIPNDRTQAVALELEVPRTSSYRLDVGVYEAERLVQRASMQLGNVGTLERNLFDTGLKISEMDFLVENVTGSRVAIAAKIYVTNEANQASEALAMQVKAREISTSLLADESSAELPSIGPEATQVVSVDLDVPAGYNYEVEAVVWDGEFIVERGQGTVQLLPTVVKSQEDELIVSTPNLDEFVRTAPGAGGGGGGATQSPAPGWSIALAAVLLGAVLVGLRRRHP